MTDSLVLSVRRDGAPELQESIRAVMRGESVDDGHALGIVRGIAEWAGASEHALVLIAASTRSSVDPEHDGDNCPYFFGEGYDCWVCRADLAVEHARGLHTDGIYECGACVFGDGPSEHHEVDDPAVAA